TRRTPDAISARCWPRAARMRTRRDVMRRRSGLHQVIKAGLFARSVVVALALSASGAAQQPAFQQTIADLSSRDADVRLRAVRMLRDTPYPEAAVPLAAAVGDHV